MSLPSLVLALAVCLPAVSARAEWSDETSAQAAAAVKQAQALNAEQTARRFVEAWLVKQDVDAALKLVDLSGIGRMMEMPASAPAAERETFARKWMCMWLFRDHGTANALGHGDVKEPGYARLPTSPAAVPERVSYSSVDAAARSLTTAVKGDLVLAAFRIPHATGDVVFLILRRVGGAWKIVDVFSVVQE